jgi:hypothetical protein
VFHAALASRRLKEAIFDSLVHADGSDFEDMVTEQDPVGQQVGSFKIIEMMHPVHSRDRKLILLLVSLEYKARQCKQCIEERLGVRPLM